jgi:N-acyl-D-aspartate/D-glutamate deacylase
MKTKVLLTCSFITLILVFLSALPSWGNNTSADSYDVLIKNGKIFDGSLKDAKNADIAIFDLENLETRTSISSPHQYSEGVRYLFINGELVLDKGEWTHKLPGTILKPNL